MFMIVLTSWGVFLKVVDLYKCTSPRREHIFKVLAPCFIQSLTCTPPGQSLWILFVGLRRNKAWKTWGQFCRFLPPSTFANLYQNRTKMRPKSTTNWTNLGQGGRWPGEYILYFYISCWTSKRNFDASTNQPKARAIDPGRPLGPFSCGPGAGVESRS